MLKTNGMIERFNDCIADVLATTRFGSSAHLADTIKRYVQVYNHHIPQKALGHIPPLHAMKTWYQKQPSLFKKCVYNLTGLDTLGMPFAYGNEANRKVKLRFGIVTDIHYADTAVRGLHHYRESMDKLAECVAFMNDKKVDFLVELGDFRAP